jgi:hypothetical protein
MPRVKKIHAAAPSLGQVVGGRQLHDAKTKKQDVIFKSWI